ncbi:MAG: type II secretion system F family protein, partial [Proteobacteria bacterium]|nr:type II secretion system F family protein [Pseudomonadota bacterium]
MAAASYLPAAVLLSAALALAPVALRLERQGKRLARRVDAATGADAARDGAARGISIRVARSRRGRPHAWASALLRVPLDQKLAHVIPVPVVLGAGVLAAIAVLWVVRIFLPLPATIGLAAFVLVMIPRGIFGWEQDRYRDALFGQLPDAIEIVVSATRAGLPVAEAFRGIVREMPKPISHEFGRVMNEIALGVPPDEALMGVHDRTGLSEFAI